MLLYTANRHMTSTSKALQKDRRQHIIQLMLPFPSCFASPGSGCHPHPPSAANGCRGRVIFPKTMERCGNDTPDGKIYEYNKRIRL